MIKKNEYPRMDIKIEIGSIFLSHIYTKGERICKGNSVERL